MSDRDWEVWEVEVDGGEAADEESTLGGEMDAEPEGDAFCGCCRMCN